MLGVPVVVVQIRALGAGLKAAADFEGVLWR